MSENAQRGKSRVHGHAADGLPQRVKPLLMDAVPWPVWRHVIYPVWVRWYMHWLRTASWKYGHYKPGQTARWRGVRLVCCTEHYAGGAADHPWDPGCGWAAWRANVLWEPARRRDRVLLRLVGDPRRA